MRLISLVPAVLCVLLWASEEAQGQAGRYIPIPRLPVPGGGGRFVPHFPFHGSGGGGGGNHDVFWVIVAIVGAVILAVVGWKLGRALGGRKSSARSAAWQTTIPPIPDLIRPPAEVAARAEQTRRLMEFMAYQDRALDPGQLHQEIAATFLRVQKAWEARDYGPIRDCLMPSILAQHVRLLGAMRDGHEINRIEDLRIDRLEFVHLHCPQRRDHHTVTALITFEATVYFVDDRTGAHTRGSRSPNRFQEFWIFRRQGENWLLQAIEPSHESSWLLKLNYAADLTEQQMENAQHSIVL